MTSDEIWALWCEANHRHMKGDERFGQALFNLLHERHPDLANQIRGTEMDPFYKFTEDSPEVFDKFWTWLKEQA